LRQYHIKLAQGDVGRYVFMPGDPGRVEKIAQYLDKARFVGLNREYCTWTGELEGVEVSVTSSGIGGPSAAIAIEELGAIGADTFIRLGTCGLLQPGLERGDLVIASGAVRGGATADAYVPPRFPAVADLEIQQALCEAAREAGWRHRRGIVQCKDAFFLEEPERLPADAVAEGEWRVWERAGVLASEMESDTLFVVGSVRGWRVGSILLGLGGRASSSPIEPASADELDRLVRCGVEGLRRLIRQDLALGV